MPVHADRRGVFLCPRIAEGQWRDAVEQAAVVSERPPHQQVAGDSSSASTVPFSPATRSAGLSAPL